MREAEKQREEMHAANHPEEGFGFGQGHSPEEQEAMESRSREMRTLSEVRACVSACGRAFLCACPRVGVRHFVVWWWWWW